MSCYPNTNLSTRERPTCGPTDPNLYAIKADTTEEVVFPEGIKDLGNGFVECVICGKEIKNSQIGIKSHVSSKAHVANAEVAVVETAEIIDEVNLDATTVAEALGVENE